MNTALQNEHRTPKMNGKLRNFLLSLSRREDLSRQQSAELLEALLAEDATDAQIAATLVALSQKGETVAELAGMADALRAHATKVKSCHASFVDTAGTGSSRAKTFNVSTAAAFVIAGAGLAVAKHGNRAASSNSGSADVLTALGVNVSTLPERTEKCLDDLGICFMFAPLYHSATKRVAGIRRELGIQTTFNLLGPLSNPAGAPTQVVGVWRRDLVERLAQVLAALGTKRAWVVHGEDGLDEITLDGKTYVAEMWEQNVKSFEISPRDFGLAESNLEGLRGGDPEANATIIRGVLSGARHDAARDLVLINAAAALFVGGKADSLTAAAKLAAESIDTGAAKMRLEQLIAATN
jgi:anthranilate phosphoribosyltransferase